MHLAGKRTASITSPIIYHNVQNYIKELEISEGQLSSCLKSVSLLAEDQISDVFLELESDSFVFEGASTRTDRRTSS